MQGGKEMAKGGKSTQSRVPEMLKKHQKDVLKDWMKEQLATPTLRPDLMKEQELYDQSAEFMGLFVDAAQRGDLTDIQAPEWTKVREMLAGLSRSRADLGFTPSETATFVFSLKQPILSRFRLEFGKEPQVFADEVWVATFLLDKLGLYTMETYQKSREAVIVRQQQEIMELSTPVVKLWEGILAVPMIGTLDSARTQVVMETLLKRIIETGSTIAIIDITGVPAVDTLVAQHLLKTVSAARLMGADCIISGISPQIAQTIVTLGVELADIITKATMADALSVAMERRGLSVVPAQ
jgi:rsbT co-antagonist protein RsbR